MEAFGRVITVLTAAFCMVFLLIVFKMAPVHWQKNETVHSIALRYAMRMLKSGVVSQTERENFEKELSRFGNYRVELTVYERRRFEGDAGRVYLYKEWNGTEERKVLSSGSYLRLFVAEEEKGTLETFLYGDGCTIVTGGRVP